jgi:hypothetical protein
MLPNWRPPLRMRGAARAPSLSHPLAWRAATESATRRHSGEMPMNSNKSADDYPGGKLIAHDAVFISFIENGEGAVL